MTHPSEPTDEYPMPRRVYQRRERDRQAHRLRLVGLWCGAIIGIAIVLKSSWSVIDAAVTAQHSFEAVITNMQRLSDNLSTQSDQLRQMQTQLATIVRHDSLQDAALADDHSQIAGLNRRKLDRPRVASGDGP